MQQRITEVIPVCTGSLGLTQCYHMFTSAPTCKTTLPYLFSVVAIMQVENANHSRLCEACGRACVVVTAVLWSQGKDSL